MNASIGPSPPGKRALRAPITPNVNAFINLKADVTRKIRGLAFNRLRLFFVSLILVIYTFYLDTWNTINQDFLFVILLSGIIGIFLGDTLLFIALQKIGPRRNNILFSLAAPFTVLLNIFFFNFYG